MIKSKELDTQFRSNGKGHCTHSNLDGSSDSTMRLSAPVWLELFKPSSVDSLSDKIRNTQDEIWQELAEPVEFKQVCLGKGS